ncbi:MAG TPA: Ig-like domain-containing protein, partial [Draconibacterium sp.]|nr:Ig-like domain-containing protein [Draconibacterium sp.]
MINELNKLKNNQSIKYNLKTNAMRKLFTRLISIFILIIVFVLQGFAQTFPALGPSSDFTNHKKTEVFVLTASEGVVAGDGVIRLKKGATTLGAYQATNSKVSIEVKDGVSTIKVDFTAFLVEEEGYTLDVDANFVKAADNGEANSAKIWDVLVGDFTPPVLAATDPLLPKNGGSTAIQLNTDLTIKFNEPVQVAAGAKLFIYKDNGTDHGDLYDVVDATDVTGGMTATLVINTNIDFEQLTKYYVTIPEGAIVDYNAAPLTDNKNKFAGWLTNDMWAFTTRDNTAPAVVDIMADNIGATKFDVFIKLNKKGKAYIMAVANGQTPLAADFIAGNGMKVVTIADPAVSVKAADFTQFLNVGTGVAPIVEGG